MNNYYGYRPKGDMTSEEAIPPKTNSLDIDINVNREQLDDTIEELRELKDTKPNITVRNNQNVYITINNFNEPEEKWIREAE